MNEKYFLFSGDEENETGRKIKKASSFDNKVVIVNGFNGSGKTLIAPIVSSFKRVEVISFPYPIEWASSLLYSKDLTQDGYCEFIKMYCDETLYNQQMSRLVNLRPSDLSSIFKSNKKFKYLSRMFKKGDDDILPKIKNKNPIINFVTCHLLPVYPSLLKALKKRLIFIETVKDPLTMYEQLSILDKNILKKDSEKDFTLRSEFEGNTRTYLDFYSNEEVYKKESNNFSERNLVRYIERIFDFYFKFPFKETDIIFVPFEDFVISPRPWLDKIAISIDDNVNNFVKKEMKRQRVPRNLLSDGLKLPIYKKYGAVNIKAKDLIEERKVVLKNVYEKFEDKTSYENLLKISEAYLNWKKELI